MKLSNAAVPQLGVLQPVVTAQVNASQVSANLWSLVIGNLTLIEVRVWGLGASLDAPALARLSLSLVIAGLTMAQIAGLLFAVVGRMVYERTHTRRFSDLRGLPLHRLLPPPAAPESSDSGRGGACAR